MTRSRYKFLPDDPCPYSITATTVNWLPLFGNPDIAAILLDSLRYLVECQRITLFGYVIMENHLHLVAAARDLSGEIAKFKSFTARKSIDYYLERNHRFVLKQLAFYKLAHKTDRPYQFWQEGSHPQRIENEAVMKQKLDYLHENPIRRGYVDLPEHCVTAVRGIMPGWRGCCPLRWRGSTARGAGSGGSHGGPWEPGN